VSVFRESLRRRLRTQRGRAESDPGRNVQPIEDPDEIARIVEEARTEGLVAYVFVVLLLDAGLRVGEALGLRWSAISWGADDSDRGRCLLIREAKPRGGNRRAAEERSGAASGSIEAAAPRAR
jgi:integrase